jgi:hypothetical protein
MIAGLARSPTRGVGFRTGAMIMASSARPSQVKIASLAQFPSPHVGFCAGATILPPSQASRWDGAGGLASIKDKWSLLKII